MISILVVITSLFSVGVLACTPVTISCDSVPNTGLREPITKLTCVGDEATAELNTLMGSTQTTISAYETVVVKPFGTDEKVYKAVPVQKKITKTLGYAHIKTQDASFLTVDNSRAVRAQYLSQGVSSVFIWENNSVLGFFATDNKIHPAVSCTATSN